MNHELHTTIDIDATPAIVWEILTDLTGYSDWNPFITSSAGRPEVGEKLINRMVPPGGKAMTFKPRVTVIEDGKTFEWLGRLVLPGVFDGRHRFELVATPTGGTRLVQAESFGGGLVRFLRKSLDTQTVQGFELMNVALKTRAETVMAVTS
jgi:hypothetical protein